jgi:hypothetical protein
MNVTLPSVNCKGLGLRVLIKFEVLHEKNKYDRKITILKCVHFLNAYKRLAKS